MIWSMLPPVSAKIMSCGAVELIDTVQPAAAVLVPEIKGDARFGIAYLVDFFEPEVGIVGKLRAVGIGEIADTADRVVRAGDRSRRSGPAR